MKATRIHPYMFLRCLKGLVFCRFKIAMLGKIKKILHKNYITVQRARKYRLKDLKRGGDEKKNTIWDEMDEAHF